MPIELGVDVDSTTVNQADAAFGKFNTTLRDAQGRFVAAGKASETADKQVRGFANAEAQAEQRTRAAIIQLQKMQGTLQGVSGMATQVQAVFAGFIGGAFIGGLTSLTMQLQKIDMTFQSVTGSAAGAAIEMAYVADTADKLGHERPDVRHGIRETACGSGRLEPWPQRYPRALRGLDRSGNVLRPEPV